MLCHRPLRKVLLSFLLLWSVSSWNAPLDARDFDQFTGCQERLAHGEVVTGMKDDGQFKYVTGSILINQAPEKVWPIMVNPYEFQGKISPRMKDVEVVLDKANRSILKVTMDLSFFFPHFMYVVDSQYGKWRADRVQANRRCLERFSWFLGDDAS